MEVKLLERNNSICFSENSTIKQVRYFLNQEHLLQSRAKIFDNCFQATQYSENVLLSLKITENNLF